MHHCNYCVPVFFFLSFFLMFGYHFQPHLFTDVNKNFFFHSLTAADRMRVQNRIINNKRLISLINLFDGTKNERKCYFTTQQVFLYSWQNLEQGLRHDEKLNDFIYTLWIILTFIVSFVFIVWWNRIIIWRLSEFLDLI